MSNTARTLGLALVVAVCGSSCQPAEPATEATDGGLDAAADTPADTSSDASTADEIQLQLEDPARLLTTSDEQPSFGSADIAALGAKVPVDAKLSATPNAEGLIGDPAGSATVVVDLLKSRPTHARLRISTHSKTGAAAPALGGLLKVSDGVVLASQVEDVEAGDAFDTSRPALKVRELSFSSSLGAGDSDTFLANVFVARGKEADVTVTIGSASLVLSTKSDSGAQLLDIDANTAATISLVRDPSGNCRNTRARVVGRGYTDAAGHVVGAFDGFLWEAGAGVGFIKGVFGHSAAKNDDLFLFKAIDRSGKFLFHGKIEHAALSARRHGDLLDAAGKTIGGITARIVPANPDGGPGPFKVAISMTMVTDCR